MQPKQNSSMSDKQNMDDKESRVRKLAVSKGYQLRRADQSEGHWHLIDPAIDGKAYAFSFTKPHTFTLDEIEQLLNQRPAGTAGARN